MRNFKRIDADFDMHVYQRIIMGRVTEARKKCVLEYTKRYNKRMSAPYGISPNGYAYRCGCEYDCCGCLVSTRMRAYIGEFGITLSIVEIYNF